MGNRQQPFASGEYYHCYNRGTDKRTVFADAQDYAYFIKSILAYNTESVLGKIKRHDTQQPENDTPITILAYSLLPNHYHLLIRNNVDDGMSKFMQRVSGGYTMYFNNKHKRSGALFQGTFKSKHVVSDQGLRQLLAYVYLNNKIHNITDKLKYRSYLKENETIVRGLTSTNLNMEEIVEIIKEQRMSFD